MSASVGVQVRPGDVLAGKYRVERVLGTGSMGFVVAAWHIDLQEMRAIKFMLPSVLAAPEYQERFLREARAAARLKSQHVAKVHDIGRLENGAPYIVMEFLEGVDLKTYLASRGPLPVMEAVTYILQACEAIGEAHAGGIVHRDIKPANMFLTQAAGGAPYIKVLDFGIAKLFGTADASGMDLTKTAEFFGSPLYMSPEQMRSARSADPRMDVWGLGMVFYQMLTGRTPFMGTTVTEICAAVVSDAPQPPIQLRGDIPPSLEAIILRCLEKNPASRFANAHELSAALLMFTRGPAPFAGSGPALGPHGRDRTLKILPATSVMQALTVQLPRTEQASPAIAPRPPMPSCSESGPHPPIPPPTAASPAAGQTTRRGGVWVQGADASHSGTRLALWALGGILALGVLVAVGFLVRSQVTDNVAPTASNGGATTFMPPGDMPSTTPSLTTGGQTTEPLPPAEDTPPTPPEAPTVEPRTSAPIPSASAAAVSRTGVLNINSLPASRVILDGRPLGWTPKVGIQVEAGEHTVHFILPDMRRKTVTVTVKPGLSAVASAKF